MDDGSAAVEDIGNDIHTTAAAAASGRSSNGSNGSRSDRFRTLDNDTTATVVDGDDSGSIGGVKEKGKKLKLPKDAALMNSNNNNNNPSNTNNNSNTNTNSSNNNKGNDKDANSVLSFRSGRTKDGRRLPPASDLSAAAAQSDVLPGRCVACIRVCVYVCVISQDRDAHNAFAVCTKQIRSAGIDRHLQQRIPKLM